MRKSLLLLALCALLEAGAAFGQFVRLLPADGVLGKTGEPQPLPLVKVDSKVLRLAPGGVIFDQSNRSIVHSFLPAGADVLYTRDQAGQIRRIYVLTDTEKAQFARGRR